MKRVTDHVRCAWTARSIEAGALHEKGWACASRDQPNHGSIKRKKNPNLLRRGEFVALGNQKVKLASLSFTSN